jgi:hypothetical protein
MPLHRHKALSSNPVQPKTKKRYLGLRKQLNVRMSAQHVQSHGFKIPNIAKSKKNNNKKKKDN